MSDAPTDEVRSFLTAAFTGDLAAVKSALANGMNVDAPGRDFYSMGSYQNVTALMCAANQGHLEIVETLLAAGANVSAITELPKSQGGSGAQALRFACISGHEAIATILLDAGADIDAHTTDGRTALVSALVGGHVSCALLLLDRGALANQQSKKKDFEYPLVVLSRVFSNTTSRIGRNGKYKFEGEWLWEQKDDVLRLYQRLLQAGADPNKADKSETTPLGFLAGRIPDDVRMPVVELLLAHGALPDATKSNGYSVLMQAADRASVQMAERLLKCGVDVNRVSISGTALDIALFVLESTERHPPGDEQLIVNAKAMVELIQQNGGLRKSELTNVPQPPALKPEPVHIATDFLKLVNTSEFEWSLLAVKAPFEATVEAYQKFAKLKKREQNVPIKLSVTGDEVPLIPAVVQVKGSPWTIILCSIFYIRLTHIKHIKNAAIALSQSLTVPVVTYAGSADTEYGRCERFEAGESAARAGSAKAIAFLTKEDIRLPACYPTKNDTENWLAVEKMSQDMIERADLLSK